VQGNIGERERSQWGTGNGGASYRSPVDLDAEGMFTYSDVPIRYERRGEKSGLLLSAHVGPLRFNGTLRQAMKARQTAIEANKRAASNIQELGAVVVELVSPKEEWDPLNEKHNIEAGVSGMGLTEGEKRVSEYSVEATTEPAKLTPERPSLILVSPGFPGDPVVTREFVEPIEVRPLVGVG
jgi:hypothetical protein